MASLARKTSAGVAVSASPGSASWVDYAIGVGAVAVALAFRYGIHDLVGLKVPYLQFYPAIIVAAWYGGFGPALVATALSALASMYFLLPPDGFPVSDHADQLSLAVFAGTGLFIAWLKHRLDVAEQAQRDAAATATARAERLDAILNTTVDGIIVIDAGGIIEAFNRGAQELFGYTESEVLGRNVSLLMPSPHHEEHDQYLARYLSTGDARVIGVGREVKGRTRDGRIVPVHLSVGEMRIGGERKFTGMLHDLTKRARLEGELGASEARWRAVVDSAVDAIIVIDAHGRVEAFNPAAERLFGYGATEVCGRNVDMLMPSPYREEHDTYLSRYLATGRAKIIGIGRDVQGRRKDGSTFPLQLSVGQMTINGERKFTGILHDLTDRVQMEARLTEQAALAKLGEMAAVVAHEVKNPLAGIRGAVQIFAKRLGDDPSHEDPEGDHRSHRRARPDDEGPAPVRAAATSEVFADRRDTAGDLDRQLDGPGPVGQRSGRGHRRGSGAIPGGRRDASHRVPEPAHQRGPCDARERDDSRGRRDRESTCQIAFSDGGPGIPAGDSRQDLHALLHHQVARVRSWVADRQTSGGGSQGSAGHRLPVHRRYYRRGAIAHRVRARA